MGDIWGRVRLVLEVGRPPEAPCLMGGPAGGENRADSVDTTASAGHGAKREKDDRERVEGLSARGSESPGDLSEAVEKRERDGKRNHPAAHRNLHLRTQLQQPFTQRPRLRPGAGRPRRSQPQFLHQHISGRRQQHAELVSPEFRTTGAVDLQSLMQLLEAVFDFSALTINLLVDPPRTLLEVGDEEARIVFGLLFLLPYHLGLEDHAPLRQPRSSGGSFRQLLVSRWK